MMCRGHGVRQQIIASLNRQRPNIIDELCQPETLDWNLATAT